MQVLELSTGDALTDLIHKSADVVVTSNRLKKPQSEVPLQAAATSAFNQLLGREPGTKELEALRATFGSTVTRSEAEDLIWSVCMLPDFQLIT